MSNLRQIAREDAKKYGISPRYFVRQINTESRFQPHVVSSAGARGAAQIMPGTAAGWGVNPDDPIAALDAAAKHMAEYVKHYGSYRNALVAYNLGHLSNKLPAETRNYIAAVLGKDPGPTAKDPAPKRSTKVTTYLPAVDKVDATQAALDALSQHAADPHQSLLKLFSDNIDSGDYTTTTPAERKTTVISAGDERRVKPAKSKGQKTANFDGKPVAPWIASELQWAREHGWRGTVNSGYRSDAEQTRIYKSGVRPAAVPRSMGGGGSNHEFTDFPGGAVDVTSAPQLAAILATKPGGSPLKWAGAKDPVHFSHPVNGRY